RQDKELVDEIVRLSTKFGIMTEYTSFLADENADHGRVLANRERAREELRRLSDAGGAADGAPGAAEGFATGENQSWRRGADKPLAAPAPTSPSGSPALGGAVPPPEAKDESYGKQRLAKAKEGGRDVEDEVLEGVQNVGNRAFYKRALASTKKAAWVDAEVKDSAQVDER